MTDETTPAAGWYPDPEKPSQDRFWDGSQWTDAFAPRPGTNPSAGPAATPPPPAPPNSDPPVSDAWARTPPAQPPGSGSPWSGSPPANNMPFPARANAAWEQINHGGTALPEYYARAFATIDAGQTKVVWNWPAFLLGAFWYLYRGMWIKALIYAAVLIFSGGVLFLPVWIYGGLMGNYDLWLLHRKNTQTW